MELFPVVLVDIDNTLTDARWRLLYARMRDWETFHRLGIRDEPNWPILNLVRALDNAGNNIVLVTGRSDRYQEPTLKWLQFFDVPFSALLMRREGDRTPDHELKPQAVKELAEKGLAPWLAIDDRPKVVAAYRALGITAIQVRADEETH